MIPSEQVAAAPLAQVPSMRPGPPPEAPSPATAPAPALVAAAVTAPDTTDPATATPDTTTPDSATPAIGIPATPAPDAVTPAAGTPITTGPVAAVPVAAARLTFDRPARRGLPVALIWGVLCGLLGLLVAPVLLGPAAIVGGFAGEHVGRRGTRKTGAAVLLGAVVGGLVTALVMR